LARRLSKAGRPDAAEEVKKLAKPSIPVWTANQLARREPGEVRALLRSAEELRKAQQRALAGKDSDLQDRLAEQRRSVRALARLGRDILADEGRSVSDAIVERIAKTLDAAALDEGSRFLLRAGRLTDELEPPGFEALAGMATARRQKGRAAAQPKGGGLAEARRRVQDAQREARERAREAERAESAADDARRAAQAARERSDEAERVLAEAEAALKKSQRR
jgi:hypothetical protein